jgi:hypothetical protein
MDTTALSNRVTALDNKLKDNKPLQYVTIGGIILAVITFFILVYLILHLLVSLLLALFGAFNTSIKSHSNQNSTSADSSQGLQMEGVYAGRIQAEYPGADRVQAERVYAQ